MKLLVLIGTDIHLNHLPHFLTHYTQLGVDLFICGLQGKQKQQARKALAAYPHEIIAEYDTYGRSTKNHLLSRFKEHQFTLIASDEWCLYADVDEFHIYPDPFFAQLAPEINVLRGRWIERLATADGVLKPCLPDGNIGEQFPFGTTSIFCGAPHKVIALRGHLAMSNDFHWANGARLHFYQHRLPVYHFRWDQTAAVKYAQQWWTHHYDLTDGCVPELANVFAVSESTSPPLPNQNENWPETQREKPQEIIWLVGDGRSGTTWLANLLNHQRQYRYLFEPLHPNHASPLSVEEHFYPYFRPGDVDGVPDHFQRIFTGDLFTGNWRYDYLFRHSPAQANEHRLLIKDIFGHLCLPWVDFHMPHVKKVLLLRHPFAVALSKSKLKRWHWLTEPILLFAEPSLSADFLSPYAHLVAEANSFFEKQVLIWAAIHYICLRKSPLCQLALVFYEDLCIDFEDTMRTLLLELGELGPEDPTPLSLIAQGPAPSHTTRYDSAINRRTDLVNSWRAQLSDADMKKGMEILKAFGLAELYSPTDGMPNKNWRMTNR